MRLVSPSLESRIDDLYRAPLATFIEARTALAKTLTGDDAKRVKSLPKPTVVPWAVNQVYWRARAVFDRVVKSGERVREAQVATLEGRKADLRGATEAHRKAIGEAVREATAIAGAEGSHPAADDLMRTFEAISLAAERDEAPGRWTKPLKPAGFEALSGVKVATKTIERIEKEKVQRKKEDAEQKKVDAARKKHEAEVKKAEAALERARQKMAEAEAALKKKKAL
jgi:hypothetical protein